MVHPLKIAIVYDSTDGHTQKISQYIAEQLSRSTDIAVTLQHVRDVGHARDLAIFDWLIFGSPIRYGKHLPNFLALLKAYLACHFQQKTAFFSVNVTARKAHRNTPETSRYVVKLFKSLHWQPDLAAVFAGKLNYPIYRFIDKRVIQFIMWLTKGPTDTSQVTEFTRWQEVDRFVEQLLATARLA